MRPSLSPLALLLLPALLWAQTPAPSVADQLVSPEVHPDGRITFRLFAPKAESVTLNGDWMPQGAQVPLRKDLDGVWSNGVWSLTVGPLAPQVYLYSFQVDGLSIADPVNPRVKLRARTSASLVEVPGQEPWHQADVPHGKVEMLTHRSQLLGGVPRQVFVYTPPGYSKSNRRFPLLFLHHGSNDVAAGWTWTGHAHLILDNLIAAGKAKPMIIVMPFGHAVPFGSPRQVQATNADRFEAYLLKEVLPLVEAEYRLLPGAANRAIVGLSMGGGQALQIGLAHLDQFSHIGAFSAAVPTDYATRFAAQLQNAKATNEKLKLFWVGIGKEDFLLERNVAFHEALTKAGIRHEWALTEGGHFYPVWRRYLAEVAPKLFQK